MKRILFIGGLAALALAGCKKAAPAPMYIQVPVERRDIVVAATAAGPVQPILTVSVKSQASGAVTEMHVQTGDDVRPGQLLALIDPRLPKSALDQAQASVDQAQASFDYNKAQLAREDTLYKVQAVTQQEYQNTRVTYEQARAALITAQANLSDAKIAYDQTRVTATLAGTIILKEVDIGTVISSPTHDVTGGTEMFQMANLDTVQVQAMVDETDVGKVSAGLPVTITVDAYPNRPFQGSVLKIEPKATVNQNVTQFPVDINIANPGHVLKPGMNTEVEIHVGTRDSVLAIPTSALRTQKDVASAAQVLGLDPAQVMEQLAAQAPKPAPNTKGDTAASMGNSAGAAGTMTLPDGRTVKLPAGVTAAQMQKVFAKMAGGNFAALTADDRALLMKMRQANGGGMGGGGGGRGRGGFGGGAGGGPGAAMQSNSYIVFALRGGKPTPVNIKTGLSDLDYIEVASGLTEKDTVLLLPSASLVQSQAQFKQRVQGMTGGGLPGVKQQPQAAGSAVVMLLGEIIAVALTAIRANKLRSLLTMLGIIIGVGAVITMVALGTGAQKAVQERIQALGPTLLTVFPGQSFRGGVAFSTRVSLTMDDDTALLNNRHYISEVVPELSSNMQVQYANQNINTTVLGSTANYFTVHTYSLVAGRMFTPGEDDARKRYAVLGGQVPVELNANPQGMIGQQIQIRGIPFEIVGILSNKGSQGFNNPDEQILIPLQTARYRVFGSNRLRDVTVEVGELTNMNLGMIEIEGILRRQHKIRPGMDDDFQIRNQTDILSTFQETAQTFGFLLAGIATVSLIVGGIGIMNIMLVSVTERTREIGVRKALGATRFNILFQFLVEALVLCMAGGIIGIIIGTGGAIVLSQLAHWNTSISLFAIILAFFFSALVGLLFGVWPARRAASLDPIDALRYE